METPSPSATADPNDPPAGGWTLTLQGRRTVVLPIDDVPGHGHLGRHQGGRHQPVAQVRLQGPVAVQAARQGGRRQARVVQPRPGQEGLHDPVLLPRRLQAQDLQQADPEEGQAARALDHRQDQGRRALLEGDEAPFRFVGGPPITQPFNNKLSAYGSHQDTAQVLSRGRPGTCGAAGVSRPFSPPRRRRANASEGASMKIRRTVMAAALLALLAVAAVVVAGAVLAGRLAGPRRRPGRPHGQRQRPDQDASPWPSSRRCPPTAAGSASSTAPGPSTRRSRSRASSSTTSSASIGGMTTLNACDVTASDNYGMTYTYDQVVNSNGVQLYNATTKEPEDAKAPLDLRDRLRAGRRAAAGRRRPAAPRRGPGDQRQPGRRRPPHGQVGEQRHPARRRSPSGRSRCSG